MRGFQANKMQGKCLENAPKPFFDRGLALARLGIHSYAIGDLLLRDWGFTLTRLGIYRKGEGSLMNRRRFASVLPKAREDNGEGSGN